MSVTQTSITQGSSSADATSYVTGAGSPTANRLQELSIEIGYLTAQASRPAITVSGAGMTWVQVNADSGHWNSGGSKYSYTYVFRAMSGSPGSGALTINLGGVTGDSCAWSWNEAGSVDISGANGSGAVAQSAANQADSGTSLTVTLGAFGSANNATFGAFGAGDNDGTPRTWTAGTGFTELHDTGASFSSITSEWRSDNDTSVDASIDSSLTAGGLGGVALELVAAASVIQPKPIIINQAVHRAASY